MKLPEPGIGAGTVALCERCGEEIAVANDLDLAGDVDRRRHLVMVEERTRSRGRGALIAVGAISRR